MRSRRRSIRPAVYKRASALKCLGVEAEAVEQLAPHAESGLPTLAHLAAEFERRRHSRPLDANPGGDRRDRPPPAKRARLVEVRPAHPTAGADPAAIVARIRGALAGRRSEAAALSEWNTLPDTIKAPTADWARSVEARLKADELVARLRAEALSRLGAGNRAPRC